MVGTLANGTSCRKWSRCPRHRRNDDCSAQFCRCKRDLSLSSVAETADAIHSVQRRRRVAVARRRCLAAAAAVSAARRIAAPFGSSHARNSMLAFAAASRAGAVQPIGALARMSAMSRMSASARIERSCACCRASAAWCICCVRTSVTAHGPSGSPSRVRSLRA